MAATVGKKTRGPHPRQARKNREHQPAWLWLALVLFLAALVAVFAASCARQETALSTVPQSVIHRSKLETGALRDTALFTDRQGWLTENRGQIQGALESFFKQSGVIPHIYLQGAESGEIAGRAERDARAQALYESLFTDGNHLLILVEEAENREEPLQYGFAVGSNAATVMDEEAQDILAAYWDISFAEGEGLTQPQKVAALGNTLKRTAENIMGQRQTGGWIWALGLITGALLLLTGHDFYRNWKRESEKEAKSQGSNT